MAHPRKSGLFGHLVSIAAASLGVLAMASMFAPEQPREFVALVQAEPAKASVPLRPSYIVPVTPVPQPARSQPEPARVSLSVRPVKAPQALPEPERETWYVTAGALNVRAGPSSGSDQLAALPMGTEVVVSGSQGKWTEISTADGLTGWVFAKYLSRAAPL